jgi:Tfp pilus assembly protein PilO
MMHIMESLTASMNETFNKTTISMNEMFHKSQASTDTTLERVQCGIAAMVDRVHALETWLPIAATDPNMVADPNTAAVDTYVDGDSFAEDTEVDNDEHFKLTDPPPRPRRPFNR